MRFFAAAGTRPTIIARVPDEGVTMQGDSVNIDITFDEPVVGLDATDLMLTGVGAATATVGVPTNLMGNIWRFPVAGLLAGPVNVSLAPDANDVEDLAGNDLLPANWSFTAAPLTPPTVQSVAVLSADWPQSFSYAAGYPIPDGAAQLTTIPWTNVNRISARFSQDVAVQLGDLTLLGVSVLDYAPLIVGFAYDRTTFTAFWTLSQSITTDSLMMSLPDTITAEETGAALDGEWTDGVSNESGNGIAGGDFQFSFNVLPGDVDRAGVETARQRG